MKPPEYLEAFVDRLGLRYIAAHELMIGIGRGNDPPPEELLGNAALGLHICDELREEFGQPISFTSFYRSPEYNASTKDSSPLSQHQGCFALDFRIAHTPQRHTQEKLQHWRGRQFVLPSWAERKPIVVLPFAELETIRAGNVQVVRWEGGLGLYRTFTHLDTRGIRATWDKR